MQPTPQQIATIDAILSTFETGRPLRRYAALTFSTGDKGQLTYGKHQASLTSGNLGKLVAAYLAEADTLHGDALRPFLPALVAQDPAVNHNSYLKNLLRAAADDPIMQQVQDAFFSATYWGPAARDAVARGFQEPLSFAVRYDSQVHGSWSKIAKLTQQDLGDSAQVGERAWIAGYVARREAWLAGGSGDLPNTVYRMQAFRDLISIGAWDLALPIVVRGEPISPEVLALPPSGCYDAPALGSRVLKVQSPIMTGRDVRLVQLALSAPGNGIETTADGQFGPMSRTAVSSFQQRRNLPVTGTVDHTVLAALGLA